MNAPKLVESIPSVSGPVKLPRLVPSRARFLAGVISGGVLLAVCLGLMGVAVSVS